MATWPMALAIGGGSLLSYLGGQNAASSASDQAAAMQEYNQILKDMLLKQEGIAQPFREGLYPALQKALGIESFTTPAVYRDVPNPDYNMTYTGSSDVNPVTLKELVTPEQTNYRQIAGYDPVKAMTELPAYAAARNPLETQYGAAKENILSSTPLGATGALARELSGLETARASSVGGIPYNLYSGLYNQAMGLATGKPELAIGAVGQMQQGAGNLLNYYGQQYGANMQNLGAIGQGLGNMLYTNYMNPASSGGTTTMNPLMFSNSFYHPGMDSYYSRLNNYPI